MRLSTTDIYVLKALGYLGAQDRERFVGSEEISKGVGVNRTYLVRLLAALSGHGLVESKKGVGGGYRLPRPPQDIGLLEVMRAVDGPIAPLSCVSLNWPKACECQNQCNVRNKVWLQIRNAVIAVLSQATVADLATDFGNGLDYGLCLDHLLHPSDLITPREL